MAKSNLHLLSAKVRKLTPPLNNYHNGRGPVSLTPFRMNIEHSLFFDFSFVIFLLLLNRTEIWLLSSGYICSYDYNNVANFGHHSAHIND